MLKLKKLLIYKYTQYTSFFNLIQFFLLVIFTLFFLKNITRSLDNIQIVIITTFIYNKNVSNIKKNIQYIVYKSLIFITTNTTAIKAIVYVDDISLINFPISKNLIIKRITKHNTYGTPFFGPLIHEAIKLFNSTYYLYINGDILISPYLYKIVTTLNRNVLNGRIKRNFLCVATRSTIYNHSLITYNQEFHYRIYNKGKKSKFYCQDAFLMNDIIYYHFSEIYNKLLIGRPGIDNIILSSVLLCDIYDVIDITNSLAAIHLEENILNKKIFSIV